MAGTAPSRSSRARKPRQRKAWPTTPRCPMNSFLIGSHPASESGRIRSRWPRGPNEIRIYRIAAPVTRRATKPCCFKEMAIGAGNSDVHHHLQAGLLKAALEGGEFIGELG